MRKVIGLYWTAPRIGIREMRRFQYFSDFAQGDASVRPVSWWHVHATRHDESVILIEGMEAMVDGLITRKSNFGPEETMNRYEAAVRGKGMIVFAHVDHAADAAAIGMSLRATELLVFGNAKGGTPLMQANQTGGIDLPLKALVYQDEGGKVWVAYNDPGWIAQRHWLGRNVAENVQELAKALDAFAAKATE